MSFEHVSCIVRCRPSLLCVSIWWCLRGELRFSVWSLFVCSPLFCVAMHSVRSLGVSLVRKAVGSSFFGAQRAARLHGARAFTSSRASSQAGLLAGIHRRSTALNATGARAFSATAHGGYNDGRRPTTPRNIVRQHHTCQPAHRSLFSHAPLVCSRSHTVMWQCARCALASCSASPWCRSSPLTSSSDSENTPRRSNRSAAQHRLQRAHRAGQASSDRAAHSPVVLCVCLCAVCAECAVCVMFSIASEPPLSLSLPSC